MDWLQFCKDHGIEYREAGKSVKRGNIYIDCPWCEDGKRYMGLDLRSGRYGCWKDPAHRSKHPTKLIATLLRCSYEEARKIAGLSVDVGLEALQRQLAGLDSRLEPFAPKLESVSPPGVELARAAAGLRAPFERYLVRRGFHPGKLFAAFGIRGTLGGQWARRVIWPLHERGRVVGWQARAIDKGAKLRVLTYPPAAAERVVWGEGYLQRGRALVICEGPFDAAAVWQATRGRVHAIASLGVAPGRARMQALARCAGMYERVGLLFDPGAESAALSFQRNADFECSVLPPLQSGDPADSDRRELASHVLAWATRAGLL